MNRSSPVGLQHFLAGTDLPGLTKTEILDLVSAESVILIVFRQYLNQERHHAED